MKDWLRLILGGLFLAVAVPFVWTRHGLAELVRKLKGEDSKP